MALACLQTTFNVVDISGDHEKLVAAVYLQVSILSQALIFVTRSQSWSIFERPGFLLMLAFVGAQMVRFTWKMVTFSSIILGVFYFEFQICTCFPQKVHLMSSSCLEILACAKYFFCIFAGRNFPCCLCQYQLRKLPCHWLGLGWCGLALQLVSLPATRCAQVHCTVHLE